MTTIATDGRTIAADGLRVMGSSIVARNEKKIRIRDGRIFAFTGTYAAFEPAVTWYLDGAAPDKRPATSADDGWSLVVIERDGGMAKWSSSAPFAEPMPYPWAFGIDSDFAFAAMMCGKTPVEAIALAAEHNVYTGGEIQVVDIAAALGQGKAEQLPPGLDGMPRAYSGKVENVLLSTPSAADDSIARGRYLKLPDAAE